MYLICYLQIEFTKIIGILGGFWGPQIKKTKNLVLSFYDDLILVKRSINFVKLLSFWVGSFATPPKQLQIIYVRLWGPQIKKNSKKPIPGI